MFVSKYPGYDDGSHNNGDELFHAGSAVENKMMAGEQPVAHLGYVLATTSNSSTTPKSCEASDSAATPEPITSQDPSTKLFTCDHCGSISAKTPRDFKRHLATAKHRRNASKDGNNDVSHEELPPPNPSTGFRCPISTCGKTFPRKDNLCRHIAKMYGISDR